MEAKSRDLDAKGVRFDITRCGDRKGKTRLCVAIDASAPEYKTPDGSKVYRVPQGF